MKLYPEYNEVQDCLKTIEDKLQWGDSANWHNDVFIELSEKIREDTSVLLSPTTLKRVWGRVNYTSAPSISTLNTLAQFAGFNNWRHFKTTKKVPSGKSWFEKTVLANSSVIIITAIVLALGFVSLYSALGNLKDEASFNFSEVKFSSQPITKGLPNSVIFNFDLQDIVSDSIYIQQYWDVTKRIKIDANQKQATGIYYYPGYFRSKLLVNGMLVREHDLFILSNTWMGTIDYNPIPKYLYKDEIFDGKLRFSQNILNEISSHETQLQTSFHYIDNFGNTSGDNLSIRQSVQSLLNDKWAVCQGLKVVILGTEGAIIIPFSQLGCISDLGLMMNDVYLSGKKHDLSMFGLDLDTNKEIEITIKNKEITVYANSTQIYQGSYNNSIGRFVGLRYRFLGAGQINSCKVVDLNTNSTILEL